MASSSLDDAVPDRSTTSSPAAQSGVQPRFNEEFDVSQRGSSLADGGNTLQRSNSAASQSLALTPSRGGTLKKRNSLKRGSSLRRSSSRRSMGAGSVKSLGLGDREKYEGADFFSAFNTPVPTKGSPTEILANRFQDWRRVLKDLISYFREVQKSHEARSKSLLSLSNLASNISGPAAFRKEGGIGEATNILKQYHKQALAESSKAKSIEDDIMQQLTGLRSDLGQKIKEIKNLSGDFKNSCDKETDATRKSIRGLQESLGLVDTDSSATSGKGDPFIVRLGVERQIERQIDEENYLHKAFLNLEHSGRELESIVVGEIQKAYNAYAGILKREADEAYETVESLRTGPVMMPKDTEWDSFVSNNDNFVDPRMPLRKPHQITYPGRDAPAAAEVRSGLLERKSKYLKSYTPGWYVLSPTHLHEFKSPDRISSQTPVMSLNLQEQKLGSHSNTDSSSHKFMLKGRQTGGMHRGHGWVFRAESRDTMLAWYEDVKNLTEKTGMERDAFVRKHARSISTHSVGAGSVSSDGAMDEDDADRVPYSANNSQLDAGQQAEPKPQRPQPGGRFPSDLNVNHDLQVPLSTSSGASSDERETIAAAAVQLQDSSAPVEGRQRELSAAAQHQTVISPRNPTEAYRQQSYHDEIYSAVEGPASVDSAGRDSDSFLASSTGQGPASQQSQLDGAWEATVVEQPASYATAPIRYSNPPAGASGVASIGMDSVNAASPQHGLHEASENVQSLALPRASSPATMATTTTTLSDPELGSSENLAFGTVHEGTASHSRADSGPSDLSMSNLHMPGQYRS